MVEKFNLGQAPAEKVLRVTVRALQQLEQLGDDWPAVTACLEALGRCDRVNPEPGEQEKVFPNTFVYCAVISAFGKAGRADKALDLFSHLLRRGPNFPEPVYPNMVTYSAVMSACRKTGWIDAELKLFEHLVREGPKFPEPVYPDTAIYSTAISAYEKFGQIDKMLALVDQLHKSDPIFLPDTLAYNTALSACIKVGRAEKALALFDHLLERGPHLSIPVYPSTVTYNVAILACEKAGRTDRYPELLRKGINGHPNKPETKIFQPSLGFNSGLNQLDLHWNAVLTEALDPKNRIPGVHSAVARAIFKCLLDPKKIWGADACGINEKTEFVVGQHGKNKLKDAIVGCMREQGWVPARPLDRNGQPNLGCLEVWQPLAPDVFPPEKKRRLNLPGREFVPRRRS